MVDKICSCLTNKIRKQMPEVDDERAEVIDYGLHLAIGEVPKTFVFIIIAALLGVLKEFFITVLVIFPYRAFSGGVHLKAHIGCILATSLMYCGIAYVSQYYLFSNELKYILIPFVWIFGMIMCRLYAPADTENVPILRKKDRKIKQLISYVVLTITLIIGIFVKDYIVSNIIILGMFVQSIMISRLAYKLTNNKYGYEVYLEEQKEINNPA
jgi:accessory gene regulator B